MKQFLMQACLTATAAFAAFALFPGCAKNEGSAEAQPGKPAAEQPATAPEDAVEEERDIGAELFSTAETLYFGGQTNEAVAVLADALENPDYAPLQRQIFSTLVRTELDVGRTDSATARVLAAYATDPALAEDATGAVYYHFSGAGDHAAALAWLEKVLALDNLAPSAMRNLREWKFLTLIALGDDDGIVAFSRQLFDMAPAGDAIRILQHGTDSLLERKLYDTASRILEAAGRTVTSDKATSSFVSTLSLRLLAERGNWDRLAATFPRATAAFDDQDLLFAMRRTLPLAKRLRKFDVIDSVSAFVITNGAFRKLSYEYAARLWVEAAQAVDVAEVPSRIAFLVGRNLQLGEVSEIFLRHAYDNIDDTKFVEEMKPCGERLVPLASDDDTRTAIRTAVLDYSFLLEDYDTAIALLEAGFVGHDKNWHEMSISKVKAHKALKENRPLDAIREFRAFMAAVQTSEEDETCDPSTGAIHTREMILGRNAARIGEIYAATGNAKDAAAAFEEARAYFTKTLTTTKDPEVKKLVEKELAGIPGK